MTVTIALGKIAAANIARAEVVVTGAGMDPIRQALTVSATQITGTVRGIPAGSSRQFTINCYSASETLTYTGTATANVVAGQLVTVRITVRSTTAQALPALRMASSATAERKYVSSSNYTTTITVELSNTGTAAATGVSIAFRARSSSGAAIGDASTTVGTVAAGSSKLVTASFTNTDYLDWESRYVSGADYTIKYAEGPDITGTVAVY